MKYPELRVLRNKQYFTVEDIADILGIKFSSAKVLSSRYTDRGLFVRLKKNLYVLSERWQQNTSQDFFCIASILQVPSYISLMTGLCFYEISTQVQRDYFEAICPRRTKSFDIEGVIFNYYKIKKEYYFDFVRRGDYFIATKEKAFVDAIYLNSLGRYNFDINSIDIEKLDFKRVNRILNKFPEKTKKIVRAICRI